MDSKGHPRVVGLAPGACVLVWTEAGVSGWAFVRGYVPWRHDRARHSRWAVEWGRRGGVLIGCAGKMRNSIGAGMGGGGHGSGGGI